MAFVIVCGVGDFLSNVKGHASPEHAPKIDQTASSASHVPPCCASSFVSHCATARTGFSFDEEGKVVFMGKDVITINPRE